MRKFLLTLFLLGCASYYQEPLPGPAPRVPPPEEWARFREAMALIRLGDPEGRVLELFRDISVRSAEGVQEVPQFGRIGIVGTSSRMGLGGTVVTYRIGYYRPGEVRIETKTVAFITCTGGKVTSISSP